MIISRFYAYLDPDTGEWDAADSVPAMRRHHYWRIEDGLLDELDQIARETWDKLPEENRAWLKYSGAISLRDVVAVDDLGDDLFEGVHIYAPFSPMNGPFHVFWDWLELSPYSKRQDVPKSFYADPSKRIDRFPVQTKKSKEA
jgi:hypothetical protein